MDLAALTSFLVPFLPYLMKTGKAIAEEAASKLGKAAWQHARALWEKLGPKVTGHSAALEAAQDLVAHPADTRAQGALELQLEKLLTEHGDLAEQVSDVWEKAKASGVVTASGERSIAVGGSARGVFVSGDQNTIG
jgi:hypothetical protein